MTNKEAAIQLVNEMVKNGWKLVNETAEDVAKRYDYDVEFFQEMLEKVKQWKKN